MYKSVNTTNSGVYELLIPSKNGDIIIQDLMITAYPELKAQISLFYTDGINIYYIYEQTMHMEPINLFIKNMNWAGWRNARLMSQIEGRPMNCHIAIKYKKNASGLSYALWKGK